MIFGGFFLFAIVVVLQELSNQADILAKVSEGAHDSCQIAILYRHGRMLAILGHLDKCPFTPCAASRVMDDVRVASVARLVTSVDVAAGDEGHAVSQLLFSARLAAVLDDGRRVVLLNDRGWSQTKLVAHGSGASRQGYPLDWSVTREEIEESAWGVVGPEHHPDYSDALSIEVHWAWLAEQLEREGVEVNPTDLAAMPREVEFGSRLRARLRD